MNLFTPLDSILLYSQFNNSDHSITAFILQTAGRELSTLECEGGTWVTDKSKLH